jgi:hypothetical protein
METGIYFRGLELITQEQYQKMIKLFGGSDIHSYNWVSNLPIDQNFGSGIPYVTNIMAAIKNNQNLNRRCNELEQRIKNKPKLTKSKSSHYTYVEEKLLWDLVQDAYLKIAHILSEESSGSVKNLLIEYGVLPFNEFKRLFGIPYEVKFEDFKTNYDLSKVEAIEEPKRLFNIEGIKGYNKPSSCYKCYNINIKKHKHLFENIGYLSFSFNETHRNFGNKNIMPYVGKVYWSTLSKNKDDHYMQIYVYDYVDSDRALQNVLNVLNK